MTANFALVHRACAGIDLHRRVDWDRWCVTRADLTDFRERVLRAVQLGEITPTPEDSFDPSDARVGPNVYTVNDQFIKPITREAGMMSWALMLHPEGLKCDLFVTHAWQEGIFEFLDKVLYSWPRGAQNAYCCMLANPQNLDINGMISSPSESPFAKSLMSAEYMLVVPNRKISIYTRLWCAYEAYLAYKSSKVIQIARVGVSKCGLWIACGSIMALAACGLLIGFLSGRAALRFVTKVAALVEVTFPLALFIIVLAESDGWRRVCHYVGAMQLGFASVADPFTPEQSVNHTGGCICGVILLMIAEMDRIRGRLATLEFTQLRQGCTGTIRDAICSNERDAENIIAEIGDKSGEVDRAIHILVRAGMWNSRLRNASARGVDIKDATQLEFAIPSVHFIVSLSLGVRLLHGDLLNRIVALANIVSTMVCCILLWSSPQDKQAFGVKALTKVILMVMLAFILFATIYFHSLVSIRCRVRSLHQDTLGKGVLQVLFNVLLVVFLVAGIDGVAEWPICGRRLAQFLSRRHRLSARSVPRKCCQEMDAGSPRSEASSDTDDDSVASGDSLVKYSPMPDSCMACRCHMACYMVLTYDTGAWTPNSDGPFCP